LANAAGADPQLCAQFNELLRSGSVLVSSMARARVPMPKSTHAFLERCEDLSQAVKNKKEPTPRSSHSAPALTP
jgi:hypothetical protein